VVVRSIVDFTIKIAVFAELEARRLRHDPLEVFTRAIQPVLWLVVFAPIMSGRIPTPPGVSYVEFIAPGVLMQSASWIALSYGIMLVWERESGILKRLLATPLSRFTIVAGRALAGAVRASTQLLIVLTVVLAMGALTRLNPLGIVVGLAVLILSCMGFTAISILLASAMKTRERFMGIINAVVMPLFFTSNALYPVQIMPYALRVVAMFNPLTYIVDALRKSMIYGDYSSMQSDLLAIAVFVLISMMIASKVFKRIIE